MCQGRSQNWAGGQRDTQTLGTLRPGWQQGEAASYPCLLLPATVRWGMGLGEQAGCNRREQGVCQGWWCREPEHAEARPWLQRVPFSLRRAAFRQDLLRGPAVHPPGASLGPADLQPGPCPEPGTQGSSVSGTNISDLHLPPPWTWTRGKQRFSGCPSSPVLSFWGPGG